MLTVDYFYCHRDDPHERPYPQMTGSAETLTDVAMTRIGLYDHGYIVHRIEVREVCPSCSGRGRYATARGKSRTQAAKLPAWKVTWKPCASCEGQGTRGPVRVFTD